MQGTNGFVHVIIEQMYNPQQYTVHVRILGIFCMLSSRVIRAPNCQSRKTVLGSILASSDTVESEGWQMKQC